MPVKGMSLGEMQRGFTERVRLWPRITLPSVCPTLLTALSEPCSGFLASPGQSRRVSNLASKVLGGRYSSLPHPWPPAFLFPPYPALLSLLWPPSLLPAPHTCPPPVTAWVFVFSLPGVFLPQASTSLLSLSKGLC